MKIGVKYILLMDTPTFQDLNSKGIKTIYIIKKILSYTLVSQKTVTIT